MGGPSRLQTRARAVDRRTELQGTAPEPSGRRSSGEAPRGARRGSEGREAIQERLQRVVPGPLGTPRRPEVVKRENCSPAPSAGPRGSRSECLNAEHPPSFPPIPSAWRPRRKHSQPLVLIGALAGAAVPGTKPAGSAGLSGLLGTSRPQRTPTRLLDTFRLCPGSPEHSAQKGKAMVGETRPSRSSLLEPRRVAVFLARPLNLL